MKSKITKNASLLIFSGIITNLIYVGLAVLLARFLSVEEFGFYGFAIAIAAVLFALSDFGISVYSLREAAKKPKATEELLSKGMASKLSLSIGVALIAAIIILVSNFSFTQTVFFALVSFSFLIDSFSSFFFHFLRARQNFKNEVIASISSKILTVILVILAFLSGFGLKEIGVVFLIGSVLNLGLAAYALNKNKIKILFKGFTNSITNIRKSFFIGANIALIAMFFAVDLVIIRTILGDFETGIYSIAAKVFFATMIITNALNQSLFPQLAEDSENKKRFAQTLIKSIKYFTLIGIGVSLLIFILKEQIVLIVFGEKFSESISLFIWLIPLVPLAFLAELIGNSLNALSLEKFLLKVIFIGFVLNLITSLIFINYFGLHGVILGTVISILTMLILNSFKLKKLF